VETIMRQVSLREFRTRGAKALGKVPAGETVLLSGQQGPAYFLVPVKGDVAIADRELRRAMAKASLRESWRWSEASGLDQMSDAEIAGAIGGMRTARRRHKSK
jgi:antitoxin (DNA-binding transcriptional repressor) of toxin-antitoxin stability system